MDDRKVERLENNVLNGQYAKQLLQNPLIEKLIIEMKGDIYAKFEKSKNDEERAEIHRELKTLLKFENKLNSIFNEGERSRKFLDEIKAKTRDTVRKLNIRQKR